MMSLCAIWGWLSCDTSSQWTVVKGPWCYLVLQDCQLLHKSFTIGAADHAFLEVCHMYIQLIAILYLLVPAYQMYKACDAQAIESQYVSGHMERKCFRLAQTSAFITGWIKRPSECVHS